MKMKELWKSKEDTINEEREEARERRIEENEEEQISTSIQVVRNLIDKQTLPDNELYKIRGIYGFWEDVQGIITKGEKVRYGTDLYRSLDEHTKEDHLTPVKANYLFVRIVPEGEVEEYEQRDYRNPYMMGDEIYWKDKKYVCTMDTVLHNPEERKEAWVLAPGEKPDVEPEPEEPVDPEPTEPEIPEEPGEEIKDWEQRYADNPYKLGEKVRWDGKIYKLVKAEGSAYNPTTYPAGWEEQ